MKKLLLTLTLTNPSTYDSGISIYIVIGAISLICIVGVIIYIKKKDK